jgi:iron complex outermembrane receptor protein
MIQTLASIAIVSFSLFPASRIACAQTHAANDSSVSRVFDIPAGPLDDAITRFATQTETSLTFDHADIQGKHSNGVHGELAIADALQILLEGTGLQGVMETSRGFKLVSRSSPPSSGAGPVAIGSITLPPITVTTTALSARQEFTAGSASAATRTDTPLFDLPQSVTVLTPDLLKSQQAQSIGDALRNVSGVSMNTTNGVTDVVGGWPSVRGYTANVLINGMPTVTPDIALTLPIAALAGIEVIKGAGSIVAGSTEPGGLINVTTKAPQADPVHELTVQAGSYGDLLTSLDLAGALTQDTSLTYRFVVSGEHASEDFFGQDGKRDLYVAPSIGYQSGGTKLVVGFEHHSFGQPLQPNTILLISGPLVSNGPLVDPAGYLYNDSTSGFYELTQRVTDAVTFHSQTRYSLLTSDFPAAYVLEAPVALAPLEAAYDPFSWRSQTNSFSTDNNLRIRLQSGALKQTMLAGFTYSRTSLRSTEMIGSIVTTPVPLKPAPSPTGLVPLYDSNVATLANTVYFQDQLSWHALHVLASISRSQQWGAEQPVQSAWSPTLGVLYQLTDSVAVYANLQKSFEAQPYLTFDGNVTPPLKGHSVEAGFKFDLFDDRLSGTLAAYQSSEQNIANTDPLHPGFSSNVQFSIVNRGIEMDVSGQIAPGWKVISSYTYSDAAPSLSGAFLQFSKHRFSLWTTYDLQGERWHGWGAGIGIWARSSYPDFNVFGDRIEIPGQASTDASIYYHAKKWSATLGVKNVFNRRLYSDYAQQTFVGIEPTRLFYLTGVYEF